MAQITHEEWNLIARGLRALWDACITKSMNERDAARGQEHRRSAERALALAERIERATTSQPRLIERR